MTAKAAIEKPVKRNAADGNLLKPKVGRLTGRLPSLKHRDYIRDFPKPVGHASRRRRGRDLFELAHYPNRRHSVRPKVRNGVTNSRLAMSSEWFVRAHEGAVLHPIAKAAVGLAVRRGRLGNLDGAR